MPVDAVPTEKLAILLPFLKVQTPLLHLNRSG